MKFYLRHTFLKLLGRTSVALFALVLSLGAATTEGKTRIGPISISPQSMNSSQIYHGYIERRLLISNHSRKDRHQVDLIYPSHFYSRNENVIEQISRSVVLAPKSTTTVSILQPPLSIAMRSNRDMRVVVDKNEREDIAITGPIFNNNRNKKLNILISQSVNRSDLQNNIKRHIFSPSSSSYGSSRNSFSKRYILKRAEVTTEGWSENWLGYSCYDGIVLRAKEFRAMPGQVQRAVWQYVETGGTLLTVGDFDPAKYHNAAIVEKENGNFTTYSVCFGKCIVSKQEKAKDWNKTFLSHININWQQTLQPWKNLNNTPEAHTSFPVIEDLETPTQTIFVMIILFAIIVGPVSYLWLARKNRRIAMVWLVPALSLLASCAIFIYSLLSEGITPYVRMQSVTLLDQKSHRAVTLGMQGYYAPLTPSNGLKFDYSTEVTPLVEYRTVNGNGRRVNLSGSQHLSDGWIQARVPAYFRIRKSEMRRERIDFSIEGSTVRIVNGLGTDIERLVLADQDGRIYTGDEIVAGKEVELTPTGQSGFRQSLDARDLYTAVQWNNLTRRLSESPQKALRPSTYIAVIKGSPFMENGLDGGKENTEAVVYGAF